MGSTIKDVARKARESITTVSRVVNNQGPVTLKTRDKVLAAIEALGYTPNYTAKRLRHCEIKTIGVIVPSVSDPFFTGFIEGIEQKATGADCHLIICCSQYNIAKEREYIKYLYDGSVDGLIFILPRISITEINSISNATRSVVVFSLNLQIDNIQSVILDNISGGYQAVMHFFSHHIAKIAYIGGVNEETDYGHWAKLAGYRKGMAECGLTVEEGYIEEGYYTEDGGQYAFHRLMKHPRPPEAILCANDKSAFGIMKAARQIGLKIPAQLKLISFDNTLMCQYTTPTLTSFDNSTHRIGMALFEKLIVNLNQQEARIQSDIQTFYPRLILRESCGCDPALQNGPLKDLKSNRLIINDNVIGNGDYQFEYIGMWSYTPAPEAYQEYNHWTFSIDSYCRMRFNGIQFKLYAARDPRNGIAGISINNQPEEMVDFYGDKREDNVLLYTSPKLPRGEHLIKIRVTGLKNENSVGVTISIDRAEVVL